MNTPAPTDLYTRTLTALTYAVRDHGRFLPLDTREHITRQLLDQLADDLVNEDQVPDPDQVSIQTGNSTYTRCSVCEEEDDTRFTLTHYLLSDQGHSHVVGQIDVCTHCLHSPFQHTYQDPRS